MKKTLLLLIAFMLLSCSAERNIVDTIAVHSDEIEAVSKRLFNRHFTETAYMIDEIDSDITKKEKRLLKDLKCQEVYLIYETTDPKAVDSLVVFTRDRTWQKEYTVVVDMRKKPRKSLPGGLVKLAGRVYYRSVQAVIPIS